VKFSFLGTSAANAYPKAFCSCHNCQGARPLGGRSARKRSAALRDRELLIDLGPDIMSAAQQRHLPLTGVRFCLQIHAHADHLDTPHLLSRSPAYGTLGAPHLHFYASMGTLREADRLLERDSLPNGLLSAESGNRLDLEIHPIEALQSFSAGSYQVTVLPANHDPIVEPLLFAIQADKHCILYATVTAELPEDAWQAFHRLNKRFEM
jgi:phosphoribosyl 1,2-cyclic phosphate phosphodiesterase